MRANLDKSDGVIKAAEQIVSLYRKYTEAYGLLADIGLHLEEHAEDNDRQDIGDAVNKLVISLGKLRELMIEQMKVGVDYDFPYEAEEDKDVGC